MEDFSEGLQITRTTVEREANGLWSAHEAPAGGASNRPGDMEVREREESMYSAFPLNSWTLLPAGGRNSVPLPRGRGMSKHDPH